MISDAGLAMSLYYLDSPQEVKCINGLLGPLFGLSIKPLKIN